MQNLYLILHHMSEMKRMQNPICPRLPVFQQSKQKLTMMMSSDRWQRKDAIFGVSVLSHGWVA